VSEKSHWRIVVLTVMVGAVGAYQVGKLPPAIPMLRAELGISMVAAGWAASLVSIAGAFLGVFAGAQAERMGVRRAIIICLAILAAGALVDAAARNTVMLLLGRTLESVGFVGIAVAGPRLIAAATQERDHGLALGMWSVYFPAGMALAMFMAPSSIEDMGWRGFWTISAFIAIVAIPVFWAATSQTFWTGPAKNPQPQILPNLKLSLQRPGPWILAVCFALYTVQWLAVMVWLPTFLIERQGFSPVTAATGVAAVVAVNIFGNLAAGWLLHHGAARWLLIVVGYIVMGTTAGAIFTAAIPGTWYLPMAILFSAVGGVIPGSLLAGCSMHAPGPQQIAIISGIIIQGSNSGNLIGPPAMAAVTGVAGWENSWLLLAGCGVAGCILAVWLRRIETRLAAA
jgi:cyanate permease